MKRRTEIDIERNRMEGTVPEDIGDSRWVTDQFTSLLGAAKVNVRAIESAEAELKAAWVTDSSAQFDQRVRRFRLLWSETRDDVLGLLQTLALQEAGRLHLLLNVDTAESDVSNLAERFDRVTTSASEFREGIDRLEAFLQEELRSANQKGVRQTYTPTPLPRRQGRLAGFLVVIAVLLGFFLMFQSKMDSNNSSGMASYSMSAQLFKELRPTAADL